MNRFLTIGGVTIDLERVITVMGSPSSVTMVMVQGQLPITVKTRDEALQAYITITRAWIAWLMREESSLDIQNAQEAAISAFTATLTPAGPRLVNSSGKSLGDQKPI